MKRIRLLVFAIPLFLAACQSGGSRDTIAQLRNMQIEIKEETIEGGLEKAMESYQRFLEETPESALTPEAIRRLADLKVEREYGYHAGTPSSGGRASAPLSAPERAVSPKDSISATAATPQSVLTEPQSNFEKRATQDSPIVGATQASIDLPEGAEELERAGARDAIELYKKLLAKYPLYERNDQVLYQLSRAYEELGQTEEAMGVMNQMVRDFPQSRYTDEVQFRRAEYFFTRKQYLDSEEAYKSIVSLGVSSSYFELALYKLGWTFYKQELYEDAMHRFIALLDNKVATGYDFAQTSDDLERKRVDDTFRVVSQSLSYLGGAEFRDELLSCQWQAQL